MGDFAQRCPGRRVALPTLTLLLFSHAAWAQKQDWPPTTAPFVPPVPAQGAGNGKVPPHSKAPVKPPLKGSEPAPASEPAPTTPKSSEPPPSESSPTPSEVPEPPPHKASEPLPSKSSEAAPPKPPPPAETPAVAPPPPAAVEPPHEHAVSEPAAKLPLGGFSDGTAYLRSPDGAFVFFLNGRLQVDGYLYGNENKTPPPTVLLRRARLELAGWVGPWAYYSIAADFAAGPPSATAAPAVQTNLQTTDNFIAIAPFDNLVILQAGQFDAPFTLENRTSDKYFDFMERSVTVRAFGIPDNKEVGAMLHGYDEKKTFYYSIGVFNGDGQNFKNLDNGFDVMGRAFIAPFPQGPLHEIEIGGSGWTGQRSNTSPPPAQTTQGGFTFFTTSTFNGIGPGTTAIVPVQLRQSGRTNAVAAELNAPFDHRFGARGELVWKNAALSESNVTSPAAAASFVGSHLRGWSGYGELWLWILGDDRLIGDQQGIEPLTRVKKFGVRPPQRGLMTSFRYEHLEETLIDDATTSPLALPNPSAGHTRVTVYELGINYWLSKRFRGTFNYVLNHFGGDTRLVQGLTSPNEQELLFRLAIAL